jgi:hypothetical protein
MGVWEYGNSILHPRSPPLANRDLELALHGDLVKMMAVDTTGAGGLVGGCADGGGMNRIQVLIS